MKAKKRGKNKSFLLRYVLIQVVIAISFLVLLMNSFPIATNRLQQETITVEEKTYFRQSKQGYHLICSYQSVRYRFPNLGMHAQYSNSDLHTLLTEGDHLTVTYFESYSLLFGKHNYIVAANKENTKLRTYEEYYKSKGRVFIPLCILFAFLEILFLGFCTLDMLVNNRIKGFLGPRK